MSGLNQPMVTIVIPCHNHQAWVVHAIESVAVQDYPRKRIVLVDDGSMDDSFGKVTRRLENAQNASSVNEPEVWSGTIGGTPVMACRFRQARGPSFARNHAIKVGWEGTDAFMFLDSDDEYLCGKISLSVRKWAEAPQHIGAVYTDFDTLNPASGLRVSQYKEPFSRDRLVRECLPNMDSLVSRVAFEQCGIFDEAMRCCEDYDLWMRVSERFIIVHIPEPLLMIRVGGHSSSATVPNAIWQRNWQRVMAKAKARMTGHD